jgi:hypothetical protein
MAPVNPAAFSGQQMPQGMGALPPSPQMTPQGGAPTQDLDPNSQESMMSYLQSKIEEMRGRMGGQEQPMGALSSFMAGTAQPAAQPAAPAAPPAQPMGGGAISDREMMMAQGIPPNLPMRG